MNPEVLAAVARFLTFAGAAVLFGLVPVTLLVLRQGLVGFEHRAWRFGEERLARRAAAGFDLAVGAVVVGTVLTLVTQTQTVHVLRHDGSVMGAFLGVLDSRFGLWAALRIPLAVALALIVRAPLRARLVEPGLPAPHQRAWWGVWLALATALLVTMPLSSHAATMSPAGPAVLNDVVHLAAGSTWLTGVAFLALVLPAAFRGKRERLQVQLLAPMLQRFSRVALIAVVLAALTGIVNTLLAGGSLGALRTTSWGEALTVKLWLFAWILAFGGANHMVLIRRLAAAAAERRETPQQAVIATSVAGEVLFGVLLLGATAVLTGQAPPH